MSVMCPECGHLFKGHTNLFGKICTECGYYIKPLTELPIVKYNKYKRLILLAKARKLIKRKRDAGGSNANSN